MLPDDTVARLNRKNRGPRRRRRGPKPLTSPPRGRQGQKPMTRTEVAKMVTSMQAQEHDRIDCGPAGQAWMDLVQNPTRDGLAPEDLTRVSARTPDGAAPFSLFGVLTAHASFSGATSTSGYITALPPCATATDVIGHIVYGGAVTTPTSSCTTHDWSLVSPQMPMFDQICPAGTMVRVAAYGLKVRCSSARETSSGLLEGGNWDGSFCGTSTSTCTTYAGACGALEGTPQPVLEGMTIRTRLDPANLDFVAMPAAAAGSTGAEWFAGFGNRPIMRFSGLSATTILAIDVYVWPELVVPPATCCLPLAPVKYEPEFRQMLHWLNSLPLIAPGNSFKSVFEAIRKGMGTVFRFVDRGVGLAVKTADVLHV